MIAEITNRVNIDTWRFIPPDLIITLNAGLIPNIIAEIIINKIPFKYAAVLINNYPLKY